MIRRRLADAVLALLAVVGVVAGAVALGSSGTQTTAAWTDANSFRADIQAGTFTVWPIQPGNANTVLGPITWEEVSATSFCARFQIRTTSTTPIVWQVALFTHQNPFDSVAPENLVSRVGGAVFAPAADYATTGIVIESGVGGAQTITNTTPREEWLCATTPLPVIVPPGPSTYSVAVTLVPSAGSPSTEACAHVVVTGLSSPFYVGYNIVFDWDDVVQTGVPGQITQAQADSLKARTSSYNTAGYNESRAAENVVTLDGGMNASIRAIASPEVKTVDWCVV